MVNNLRQNSPSARTLPEHCQNFAQTLPKLCPNIAQTLPKLWPKLCPNFARTLPELCPNLLLELTIAQYKFYWNYNFFTATVFFSWTDNSRFLDELLDIFQVYGKTWSNRKTGLFSPSYWRFIVRKIIKKKEECFLK